MITARNKLGQIIGTPPVYRNCIMCGRNFSISGSSKNRRIKKAKFCSQKCHYKFGHIEQTKQKISESLSGEKNPFYGKKHTKATKLKISNSLYGKTGEKNGNWRGGITPINQALRNSLEYEKWRTNVFERDLYTCQICGTVGEYLHADHIKPFAFYPELRFEISNGRTLCWRCHYELTFSRPLSKDIKIWGRRKKTTWGGRVWQIAE